MSAVHAQTPPPAPSPLGRLPVLGAPVDDPKPAAPLQAVPQPMPPVAPKAVEVKPSTNPLVPAMPAETIPAPTMALFPSTCSTCGDVNPACADPGCAGGMIPGPKDPVWMNNGVMIMWFQPPRQSFPLAVGATPGGPSTVLLSGRPELGRYIAPKIDGGLWLNKDHTVGAGIDGFITEQRSVFQTVTGSGTDGLTILRPFTNAANGAPASLVVAAPGIPGAASTTNSARFASLGAHLRRNVVANDTWEFDLMFGTRFYDLEETLQVYQRTTLPGAVTLPAFPAGAGVAGAAVELRDRVFTRNQFYGGELGSRLEYNHGCFFAAVTPKLAFGEVHQVTQIYGQTTLGGATQLGGLLAAGGGSTINGQFVQNGNINGFVTNRFAVATDVGTEFGVHLSKNTRVAVGYQFYYLNTVARPGQQLDPTINTRVVPVSPAFGSVTGPVAPNVTVDREGFYAHGVSFLFEARY